MKIKIEELGPIRKANIDLDKKLTLFCGYNGTGKTYLSYLIYSLTKREIIYIPDLDSQDFMTSLLNNNQAEIEINPSIVIKSKQEICENLKKDLDSVFGLSKEDANSIFKKLNIEFCINEDKCLNKLKNASFEDNLSLSDDFVIWYKKEANSLSISIKICKEENLSIIKNKSFIYDIILSHIYTRCAIYPISSSAIFPVERNSVYTFKTELSLTRNTLIDQMQKNLNNSNFNPIELLQKSTNRYPQAVTDCLTIANDLATIQKNCSPFYSIAEEIEAEILNGTVNVTKDGDVLFVSNKTKSRKLHFHMTASLVKTLSSLIFYLKHIASKDVLIIIDEPEMNLHPDSQIKLAQIFGKLINRGIRLLISTHSDYIIREINNLVSISSSNQSVRKKATELGYNLECAIKPDDVSVYYFDFTTKTKVDPKEIEIFNNGFEVPSIDIVIEKQNQIAEELFISEKYGDE